ncbi:VgrG-related protein [Paraburkholderia diazotrophica]|uniref:Type VI secretion system spike protein VgrG3-like C-terminal domain-containing protein n=1 Tax=Paraburkholderia diazotrophica TaxID=667676 RepID=A0A1H7CTB9_9BURK|nr:lytic transglycosylase domain-containing protein [Paraburkholderia diazotrophica]SEJ92973.1 hypothetical protein SAMN05192539_102452 [Paraburkholderia diazotrophica]
MTTQPAASEKPVSTEPSIRWTYPFATKDKKPVADPQTCYSAFGLMDDGYYPLGVNGFPHGGVHFGAATASYLYQADGVQCIADGEIVAYRIDDAYPHLHFAQDGKWAMYSTGFVLVRHRMTLPPAPGTTATQSADEMQMVYSLYMHMADWSTYLADGKLARPWWWEGVDAYRIGSKAHQLPGHDGSPGTAGAFVWTAPKTGKRVGFLPEGSEITINERRGQWAHIKTITAGTMISPTNGGVFGSDDLNVPWQRPDSHTPDGAASAHEAPPAPVTSEGDWGWLFLPHLQPVKEPTGVGTVVIPHVPIKIKAGTLLGQIGEYHDYERATPLPPRPARLLLHLEVFAGPEFSAFLQKSRARAAQSPADQRTVFVVNAGARLVPAPAPANTRLGVRGPVAKVTLMQCPASGPWVLVQALCHAQGALLVKDGPPVWIERDKLATAGNGTPAWSQFPLQLQAIAEPACGLIHTSSLAELDALDTADKAVDERGVRWWRIPIGNAKGQPARGWVCEKGHPGTQWDSPWAWPGFEVVDATGISLTDAFRRALVVTGVADWKEQREFEPSTEAINGSALLLRLERIVAALDTDKRNSKDAGNVVTARALRAALREPWLAQELSHIIMRYESEWGGDMGRWQALTALMKNAKQNWQCELERIRKLQWWDEVKGKVADFPASPVVYHINPVALVATFAIARKRRDYDLGKLSSQYETGGRGPITISGGQGDPGGVSYGSYQMTSKTRQRDGSFIIGGTVQKFANSPDFPWASEFVGLTPGTPGFSQKWRAIVSENTAEFTRIEHEFIKKTHFDVQIAYVKAQTGVDLRYHSHAINDVVWSISVQNGPSTDVISTAMSNLVIAATETRAYDMALIDAIYAERGKKDPQGRMIRFIHSSSAIQDGISHRYGSERRKAQEELKDEIDY